MGMLSKLSHKQVLRRADYAIPDAKSYPIQDERTAMMSLKRVEKHGTTAEKKAVRAAIKKRYPDMGG